jgi:ComEC/Rec2-related protein
MRDRTREPGDATPTETPRAWIAAVAMFAGAHASWWVATSRGAGGGWSEEAHGAWGAFTALAVGATMAMGAHALLRGRHRSPATTRAIAQTITHAMGRAVIPMSIAAAGSVAGALLAIAAESTSIDAPTAPCPVTVEGIVATHPRPVDEGCDRLARFIVREAGQSFVLAVDTDMCGSDRGPCTLEVAVRVAGLDALPERGSRIRVRGWMTVLDTKPFPGSGPSRRRATLDVESSRLIERIEHDRLSALTRSLRSTANGALVASMPTGTPAPTVALAVAMTTGVRMHGLDDPAADFRIAGMSHVLAISGFNVAVLVSVASAAARGARASFRMRACVAIAVAMLFLALTEPETSVLRAGWGAVIAAVASIRGGHARGLGTLGAVACITMAADIESARGAGFQLSYGTVAALLTLTPRVEARWKPRIDSIFSKMNGSEVLRRVTHALMGAAIASTVAWSVSTPIALMHMGSASGWAVALSIATMPVAATVTVAGCCAMAVGSVAGAWAAAPFGWIAATSASMLQWTASRATDLPGAAWWSGSVPGWWCCAMLACAVVSWCSSRADRRRAARWCIVALAAASWFGWTAAHRASPDEGSIEVIRLRLGPSTCTVVRSCDVSIVVDPGSAMDPSAGTRRIVPALAELGIRRLDAVVVSRTRLACVSAIPEVIEAFAPRVIVVRSTETPAAGDPTPREAPRRGAWAAVLTHARESGVHVVHPSSTDAPADVNGLLHPMAPVSWATEGPNDTERALFDRSFAVRTVHSPGGMATTFVWTDHGWRPADTTTARRSSTQSPAMLPSSDSMTSSNGASARSARSSNDASPVAMR